jgi:endonuclease/exonuclease/phosphatase family metal-dependent hydrolase
MAALLALCSASGCASFGFNYLSPRGPRCAGGLRDSPPAIEAGDAGRTFTIVSFNVRFGAEPQKALRTLERAGLDKSDVLLLQEMDLPATLQIARALGVDYVYYPAALHPTSRRQFGVAILSPWPIRQDRKILLTLLHSSDDARKVAASAVVWVKGVPVGIVNAHLQSGLSPVQLGDQIQVLAHCAFTELCPQRSAPMLPELPYYLMAGDFNTRGDAHIAVMREVLGWFGLAMAPGIDKTQKYLPHSMGRLDHIFASSSLEVLEAGVVPGFFGTGSDHRPVWARLRFKGDPPVPWEGFDPTETWASETTDTTTCVCEAPGCP